jgi:TRAP-type transport system periplasmic protein
LKRRKLVALCLVLSLICTFCLSGCAQQNSGEVADNGYNQVTLLLNCNGTEIANDTKMAKAFKKYVEERSDGVVTIKVFPNDQLASGNMNKGLEMITNGTTDLDIHSTSIISNLDGRLMVCTMPWLFDSYEQAEKIFFGTGGEFIDKVVQEKGLTYLGAVHNGFKAITNSKRSIKKPSDLKGLKIRIPGGAYYTSFYKAFGASPQAMSWSEVFTALQQGTIDGQDNSLSTCNSGNIQEVQKYITIARYTYEAFTFTANSAKFNSLNEKTQKLLKECAKDACHDVDQEIVSGEADILKKFKEAGCVINELSDSDIEEFKKVVEPLKKQYIKVYGEEACKAFGVTE